MNELVVENVSVAREGSTIVSGIGLRIAPGEVHILVGKNGAGKSTLLNALMGHPSFATTEGSVKLDGQDITHAAPHERAKRGLFLSLQQPPEIPGVPLKDFLSTAVTAVSGERPKDVDFDTSLAESLGLLRLDPKFATRSLNEGFSGGEKKRSEIVQMLMLRPKYALLDEPDSGLDAEAVTYMVEAIQKLRQAGTGFLIVTHYEHVIAQLQPTAVYTLENGTLTAQP